MATEVQGRLEIPVALDVEVSTPRVAGYVRTPVAEPSTRFQSRTVQTTLFFKAVDTLPIPAPDRPYQVVIDGYRFLPAVSSCAVDGKLEILNRHPMPLTLKLDTEDIGPVNPGEAIVHTCTAGPKGDAIRTLSVVEHPFIRGSTFVGEVGVAVLPEPNGRFSASLPQGQYELLVVTSESVIHREAVEVQGSRRVMDLGVVPPVDPALGASRERRSDALRRGLQP